MTKKILWGLLSIFFLIQFVSPARNESNVTEPDDIFKNYPATDNIKALIKTSCYDFIQTIQGNPWYAEIQPLAWWLDHHIEEGKDELNFSDFAAFNSRYKSHKLDEIMELVNEGEIPLKSYLITHSEARLRDAQRRFFFKWAEEVKRVIKAREP